MASTTLILGIRDASVLQLFMSYPAAYNRWCKRERCIDENPDTVSLPVELIETF